MHEVGHYIVATLYGLEAYIRVVTTGGIPSIAYTNVDFPSQHMMAYLPGTALAGPMMNLLIASVLALIMFLIDDWASGVVASINAGMCITNALPSFEMVNMTFRILPLNDGGKAVYYSSVYPGMHVLCWLCIALMSSLSIIILAYGIRYIASS
ncbi:MAG: hypothetical protein DRO39_04245 [Thermoprotei archaeon]|nr:MAG: hypothetical protein DRO39_04245 [Thermoprotei archaeon]